MLLHTCDGDKNTSLAAVVANGIVWIDTPEFEAVKEKYRDVFLEEQHIRGLRQEIEQELKPYKVYLE